MPNFCTDRLGVRCFFTGFRPPLIKDRGDISEIFLIGSYNSYLYFTFEPKSPSAPDMPADAHSDAHAMGIE